MPVHLSWHDGGAGGDRDRGHPEEVGGKDVAAEGGVGQELGEAADGHQKGQDGPVTGGEKRLNGLCEAHLLSLSRVPPDPV